MLLRTLDYEEQFRCLAGRCPHSCCIGWEVVLDEDHARRYLTGDDPLSRRAAEAMVYDETEDAFAFPLSGGRCPFLDGEDLCALHRAWGAEATPLTCQTHPRFTEEFGPFAERALSAACPAANALLLGSREPLGFREVETGDPGEEGDAWLPYLVPFRQRLFETLRDRSRPLRARLAEFLTLCLLGDAVLADAEREGAAPEGLLTLEGGTLEGELPEEGIFPAGFRLLASLEVLEPDWRDVLARAGAAVPAGTGEGLPEAAGPAAGWHPTVKRNTNRNKHTQKFRFVMVSSPYFLPLRCPRPPGRRPWAGPGRPRFSGLGSRRGAGWTLGKAPSTPGRVKSIWPLPGLAAAQRTSRGIPKV